MSNLQYFNYPGFGERSKRDLNYSQAVRIDNRIEVSGQGGWDRTTEEYPDELSKEVDQAFDNVEHAIRQAGGEGWDQVYKTRIYVTVPIDEIAEPIIRNMKERCKRHGPLMTVVQVVALYKTMKIEIEAEAHFGVASTNEKSFLFIIRGIADARELSADIHPPARAPRKSPSPSPSLTTVATPSQRSNAKSIPEQAGECWKKDGQLPTDSGMANIQMPHVDSLRALHLLLASISEPWSTWKKTKSFTRDSTTNDADTSQTRTLHVRGLTRGPKDAGPASLSASEQTTFFMSTDLEDFPTAGYLCYFFQPQRIMQISNLNIEWDLDRNQYFQVNLMPVHHRVEWYRLWDGLSKMTGLKRLHIKLYFCLDLWQGCYGEFWEQNSKEILQPVKKITAPREFVINLPNWRCSTEIDTGESNCVFQLPERDDQESSAS
ncbi:hypothetical protein J4E83_009223 [Alternaria metachromatica]|uniref:uncharacterized protein n=2 Tax=Alternaria sect. Infectoriae TaxID=2499258 RepID=UPI0020C5AF77|nr:uncharacterized protein J4E83_009223 [Alternaria metachromatica]KAI4608040.1 hypothetical protein J4E83_009223 [Alternaria metachromatica]